MFPATFLDSEAGTDTQKLRAEYDAAVERRRATRSDVERADEAIRRAPQLDASEYAAAMRKNKPDPGPVNRLAAEAALEDARRRFAGETAAVKSIEQDIERLRRERFASWQADTVARIAEARRDAEAAFVAYTAAQQRVDELRQIDAWIATGSPKVRQETTAIRNASGQPLSVPKLLEAVQEVVTAVE